MANLGTLGWKICQFKINNDKCQINVELQENKTGEITAATYLLSIAEIKNSARQIGTGSLLTVNNYILGLIWGTDCTHLFDFLTKDEYGNLSSSGTAVLLKFDSLNLLENFIRLVYYNTFPQNLFFQVQFIKVHCSVNTKTVIKCALKKEQLSARQEKDLDIKKVNIMIQRKNKMELKRDITIKINK